MVKMEYKRKRSKKIKNGEANFLENNAVSYSKKGKIIWNRSQNRKLDPEPKLNRNRKKHIGSATVLTNDAIRL
jgi:hypothetical protein